MEKSLQIIEQKIDTVSTVVISLSVRLDSLADQVTHLSENLEVVTIAVGDIARTVDDLAAMTARQFSVVDRRLNAIETTMATKADKADTLALYDKFPSTRQFNDLTLRVATLEEKVG